jgi:tRNA(adenine34) deaminase
MPVNPDEQYMKAALAEARTARDLDEVPVGAVVVCGGRIVARAHNMTEKLTDATAHAEMIALTAASHFLNAKYLRECTLYVTLEPCLMCAGAAFWTQLGRLVYGASDPKRGFTRSGKKILHPSTRTVAGVLREACGELLTAYFKSKRL